jgi:hypothetical protein
MNHYKFCCNDEYKRGSVNQSETRMRTAAATALAPKMYSSTSKSVSTVIATGDTPARQSNYFLYFPNCLGSSAYFSWYCTGVRSSADFIRWRIGIKNTQQALSRIRNGASSLKSTEWTSSLRVLGWTTTGRYWSYHNRPIPSPSLLLIEIALT